MTINMVPYIETIVSLYEDFPVISFRLVKMGYILQCIYSWFSYGFGEKHLFPLYIIHIAEEKLTSKTFKQGSSPTSSIYK